MSEELGSPPPIGPEHVDRYTELVKVAHVAKMIKGLGYDDYDDFREGPGNTIVEYGKKRFTVSDGPIERTVHDKIGSSSKFVTDDNVNLYLIPDYRVTEGHLGNTSFYGKDMGVVYHILPKGEDPKRLDSKKAEEILKLEPLCAALSVLHYFYDRKKEKE
jgi:hypothetical protein